MFFMDILSITYGVNFYSRMHLGDNKFWKFVQVFLFKLWPCNPLN